MDTEHNRRAVIEAWKVFASRDAQRVAALFTDDAEWLAPAGNATAVALGHTHQMIGAASIARFITQEFHRLFASDVAIDFRGVYADGDTVVVEERMQATLASGRPYDNDYCFVFELRDGRIHRVREYMDTQRGRQLILGPAS